jgi:hypothetical protein
MIGAVTEVTDEGAAQHLARVIMGLEKVEVTPQMQHGTHTENEARLWTQVHLIKDKIEETGFGVPKWDLRFGASPDGLVGDYGVLEIKCPTKMYGLLEDYLLRREAGIETIGIEHIFKSHRAQMHLEMAVFGRRIADYVVYCNTPGDAKVFHQRIAFDEAYWQQLYTKAAAFHERYLVPLMQK